MIAPYFRRIGNNIGPAGFHSGMHKRPFAMSIVLLLALATAAGAADISGSWKADLETPQGKVAISYSFQQDGDKLTGTWQTAQSPTCQISEGRIEGDKLSFVVKPVPSVTFAHEGKIVSGEIQLTMKPSGEFPGATVVAKRVRQ